MKTYTKYDIFSKFYDLFESSLEKKSFSKWREMLFEKIPTNSKVLEIGVGTGKNIPYYPENVDVVGIDFSQGMLEKAILKSKRYPNKKVKLIRMDVTNMNFPKNTFDFVVATFVFCTVPNPIVGFKEVRRVIKPSGQAIFLEHMRSEKWVNNIPLYVMNPLVKTLVGTSLIRKTRENILRSGLKIVEEKKLFLDIVNLFTCKKG